MPLTCPHASSKKDGMQHYVMCDITKDVCAFYRYCVTEGNVVNTDGAVTCKARNKEQSEEVVQEKKKTLPKKTSKQKSSGVVTLVAKTYIVYECDGNSCLLNGKFDYKIGDIIDV